MKTFAIFATVVTILFYAPAVSSQQKKIKVIADQDSAGPQGTNFLSLLMLLRAKQIDLLGITTVSGDQWVEPATVFALWATEITSRTDVPVIRGAEMPLEYATRAGASRRAVRFPWLARIVQSGRSRRTKLCAAGRISNQASPARRDFIIDTTGEPGEGCSLKRTAHEHWLACDGPGESSADQKDYIMGGSAWGRELNWWWILSGATVREPWKEIIVTPFETAIRCGPASG
jgi:hypothetical protein